MESSAPAHFITPVTCPQYADSGSHPAPRILSRWQQRSSNIRLPKFASAEARHPCPRPAHGTLTASVIAAHSHLCTIMYISADPSGRPRNPQQVVKHELHTTSPDIIQLGLKVACRCGAGLRAAEEPAAHHHSSPSSCALRCQPTSNMSASEVVHSGS